MRAIKSTYFEMLGFLYFHKIAFWSMCLSFGVKLEDMYMGIFYEIVLFHGGAVNKTFIEVLDLNRPS